MVNVGNWVSEFTNTIGTGNITLTGGYQGQVTFAKAFEPGLVYYSILDGTNRECGTADFDGITGLVRTEITATYENGVYNTVNPTPINLSGSAIVSCTYNASAFEEQRAEALAAITSASAASASEINAAASAIIASDSANASSADRVQTALDRVAVAADAVIAANAAIATAADRAQTGLDRISTSNDAAIASASAAEAATSAAAVTAYSNIAWATSYVLDGDLVVTYSDLSSSVPSLVDGELILTY